MKTMTKQEAPAEDALESGAWQSIGGIAARLVEEARKAQADRK